MAQMLLFPDPRPLVDALGRQFFREAPQCPGVYLMRDAGERVLYVGKAKNLRRRLTSYRVANPERMQRRHLRLLRAIRRIELQQCPDEASALSRESELLRALRPPFNRAGTWTGPLRYLRCRIVDGQVALAVTAEPEEGWMCCGPMGSGALALRAALARLLWCACHPSRGVMDLPAGWFRGWFGETASVAIEEAADLDAAQERLAELFSGKTDGFCSWVRERLPAQEQPFGEATREADLETVIRLFSKPTLGAVDAGRL